MGFLDKVKAQAEQALNQGKDKLEDFQAKRESDALLRSLGAWYYARETNRDNGNGDAEIARIVGELQAHEAEHGPLGGDAPDPAAAQGVDPAGASPPPTAPAPNPPPAAPATPAPSAAPEPSDEGPDPQSAAPPF